MRSRKRILNLRRQSRIDQPKQNLWFFSESSTGDSIAASDKKPSRREQQYGIFKDDLKRTSGEKSKISLSATTPDPFVVDWQISDVM